MLPFCCVIILLAAWCIRWGHKLCIRQFSPQNSSSLRRVPFCTFTCNLCEEIIQMGTQLRTHSIQRDAGTISNP